MSAAPGQRLSICGAWVVDGALKLEPAAVVQAKQEVEQSWSPTPGLSIPLLRYDDPVASQGYGSDYDVRWAAESAEFGLVMIKDARDIPIHCSEFVEEFMTAGIHLDMFSLEPLRHEVPSSIQDALQSGVVEVHAGVALESFEREIRTAINRRVVTLRSMSIPSGTADTVGVSRPKWKLQLR